MIFFFTTVIIITLFLDWYTFQGVRTLTGSDTKEQVRWMVRFSYWMITLALFAWLFYTLFSLQKLKITPPSTYYVFSAYITIYVTKLVFVLVLFWEDIYRLVAAMVKVVQNKGRLKTSYLPGRRKFVTQMGILIATAPFLSFIYGISRGKYDYHVHRHILYFDDLPESFVGFTITQLSDIHAGSFDNHEAVKRGIDLVVEQASDLFVATGDIVNNVSDELLPWINEFSRIKAPHGQFAVLGNHDYGDYVNWSSEEAKAQNLEKLKKYHGQLGYRLLLNENITIEKNGQKLSLIGVENWGLGFVKKGNLKKALEGVEDNAFKILLSHDPSHWEQEVKYHPVNIQLTLSGHTHGMQFGVETPAFSWSPVQFRYKHWAGLATENNRKLYINRGFGFIGLSGRVGIWPEITVIELRKG